VAACFTLWGVVVVVQKYTSTVVRHDIFHHIISMCTKHHHHAAPSSYVLYLLYSPKNTAAVTAIILFLLSEYSYSYSYGTFNEDSLDKWKKRETVVDIRFKQALFGQPATAGRQERERENRIEFSFGIPSPPVMWLMIQNNSVPIMRLYWCYCDCGSCPRCCCCCCGCALRAADASKSS
jgi:hypothetical protein